MVRREFLRFTGAAVGSWLVAIRGTPAADGPKPGELFGISLAQWSLHRRFFNDKADPMEFARMSRQEFGIDAVEYVNQFYKDKKHDDDALKELKKRADDLGVKSVLIMCDGEGALGDPDAAKRRQAVENHFRWVEWAKHLGCHSIRVNAASAGTYREQRDRAADGLRQLTEFAAPHDINVIVENHGGISSNGAWLADVMRKVDHPRCGTLPDFGNFRITSKIEYDRYQGVKELMPFAYGVSAKSHEFDDRGNEVHTDYRRMIPIVLSFGYRGYVGIEYEGSKHSEPDGIKLTKKLLETVRGELG
jgi:sugar phosphate isomerase/epimerase